MTPRDLQDGVHVRGLTEEMDWNNGLRARSNQRLRCRRVDVEALGVGIREYRAGAHARDAARGGEKREGGADHLIARADIERHQGGEDRVRAGREPDGEAGAGDLGRGFFERSTSGPRMYWPDARTRLQASRSSPAMGSFSRRTSNIGTRINDSIWYQSAAARRSRRLVSYEVSREPT